ncbi:hypothetical protein [Bifidobacterium vespertilionis]|uniref:Uncharacterized protein n=1 Tax=Bifidobacterium vespertilionis TaxID=2562524 RepID=A0A5J5E1M3_9BIFI|nr:hypothetical protein [Bifidobacterium vespertilionis]KAA8818622.1 hypothetical protein EMO90_09635 [Bifidobacterium vespertilionis]KAA8823077.1 hypothetical protein EM848_06920 [Bifidobacterium vespertilionis]MBT1179674.1 hypothetical protein [Bifidobacterium vespertilionis]
MALGLFPQQFLPRLNVTFTAFPGTTKAEIVDDERRFLDAQTLVGPIPLMIDDALNAVVKNMRTGSTGCKIKESLFHILFTIDSYTNFFHNDISYKVDHNSSWLGCRYCFTTTQRNIL